MFDDLDPTLFYVVKGNALTDEEGYLTLTAALTAAHSVREDVRTELFTPVVIVRDLTELVEV